MLGFDALVMVIWSIWWVFVCVFAGEFGVGIGCWWWGFVGLAGLYGLCRLA